MNKIILLLFLLFCKRPEDKLAVEIEKKEFNSHAVVMSTSGESRIIHSDLTEEKTSLGSSFKTGDKILTGAKSKVDISIGKSISIRILENSILEFPKLFQLNETENTKIFLKKGKLFINKKTEKNLNSFELITETLFVIIKSNSFFVERVEEEEILFKILEGKLVISPRVENFEKISLSEIDSNSNFKKLSQSLKTATLQVSKEEEIFLNPKVKIFESKKIDSNSISKMISEIESFKNFKPTLSSITKNEQQELKTILPVDTKLAIEIAKLNEELASGKLDEKKADELEKKRVGLQKQILGKQEVEKSKFNEEVVVKPRKLKTKKEIIKYYERIEKIILSDGRFEIGAIINQEDSIMVIHTESGIVRVNTNDIVEVIYDYQTKVKF